MEDIEKSMNKAEKNQIIDNFDKGPTNMTNNKSNFITMKKAIFMAILGAIGIILYIL